MGRKSSIANRLNKRDTMSTLMGDIDFRKEIKKEENGNIVEEINKEPINAINIPEEKASTEIIPTTTTTVEKETSVSTNSYSPKSNMSEVYKNMISLRKSDKEQDNEIKVLLYKYATDVQIKTITDSNNNVKNVEYIDKDSNSKILGIVIDLLSEKIAQRSISDNEKNSLFTQLMIDFIIDRLKFIAKTELINESTPKYIEQCMNDFFESASEVNEEIKKELINDSLESVISDVENFVERKTFYMKALSSEAIKLYCKTTDVKLYDALNKFILEGLSNEEIGRNCIAMAKNKLYEKGCLKQSEVTKTSKKLRKYDI